MYFFYIYILCDSFFANSVVVLLLCVRTEPYHIEQGHL